MREVLARLLVLAIAATPVPGAAASPAEPPALFTFRFTPLDAPVRTAADGNAFVDFGVVTARSRDDRRRGIVIRQRVAVRLDGRPGAPASARVSAALGAEMPGCTVRVDGVTLSTLPRVIDAVHRVGTTAVHQIEVTIPASVPAGAFLSDLQWFADSG